MAIQAKVVSFNVSSSAAGTTQNVTGFGFNPCAFMFFWSGIVATADQTSGSDMSHGVGFATGATDRRCVFSHVQDAVADSSADHGHRRDSVIATMDGIGAMDGIADVDALITDGVRIIIDDQFSTSPLIHVLGMAGYANSETLDFVVPAATGCQSVTTANFQGDVVLFAGAWIATSPASTRTGGSLNLGIAMASASRGTIETTIEDAQMASDSAAYGISSECIAISNIANANALVSNADFEEFLSNGFKLDWSAVHVSTKSFIHALLLKGGSHSVGNLATRTDTNDIVVSGLSFKPAGGILASVGRAESTANTPTADTEFNVGAFDSPTSRGAHTVWDDDAADPMIAGNAVQLDEVYINMAPATDAVDGLMDIKSIENTGATFVMDDTDPAAAFVLYWLFGDPVIEAKKYTPLRKVERLPHYRM